MFATALPSLSITEKCVVSSLSDSAIVTMSFPSSTLLEARLIAGSEKLYDTFSQAYRSYYVSEDPKGYIAARQEDPAQRRAFLALEWAEPGLRLVGGVTSPPREGSALYEVWMEGSGAEHHSRLHRGTDQGADR